MTKNQRIADIQANVKALATELAGLAGIAKDGIEIFECDSSSISRIEEQIDEQEVLPSGIMERVMENGLQQTLYHYVMPDGRFLTIGFTTGPRDSVQTGQPKARQKGHDNPEVVHKQLWLWS